jgi:hypothetical protein
MNEIERAIESCNNRIKACRAKLAKTHPESYANSIRLENLKIEALREKQERMNPKPLTLEELREQIGKPAYIKLFDPDEEFWVLRNSWVDTRVPEPNILFHMRWYSHKDYGKTWIAYDHEPKGADG